MLGRLAIIISRLRARHIVLVAAASVSVAVAVWIWRAHRDAGPRLAPCECAQIHLGDGAPGVVVTGSWPLTNIGRADLDFTVFTTCDCGEITPAQGRITPGETQDIRLTIKLGKRGERKGGYVTVQTNDPENPMVSRYMFADCPPVLRVLPPSVNLDPVFAGRSAGASCRLTVLDANGHPLPKGTPLDLRWTSKHILVGREVARDNDLELRVSCMPDTPAGELSDSLELRPGNSREVVRVPIRVRVVGQLAAAPSTLFLTKSPTTDVYEEREVLVWSLNGQRPLGRLLDVQAPNGVSVTVVDRSGSGRVRLRVRSAQDDSWGPEGRIVLRWDGVEQPVVIKVVKATESTDSGRL